MKKIKLFPVILILIINFFILVSFSQEKIDVKFPSIININAGQKISVPIELINLEDKEIKVFLNIFPPYYEGIVAFLERNEIILSPNSKDKINLIISVPSDITNRIITYQLFLKFDNIQKNYRLNLNVIGERGEINVENFEINKYEFNPDENLIISIKYRNTRDYSTSIKVKIEVLRDNEILNISERFLNILARSSIDLLYIYNFTYFHKPGKYSFIVYSFDEKENLISRLIFEVNLKEIREIKRDVKIERSLLLYKVTINLKNVGNVIQKTTIEEEFPIILKPFVIFENYQPQFIENKAIWNIELNPQEEIIISYSIIYWIPFLITLIILLSIVISLIFFVFVPKTIKEYKKIEDVYKIKIVLKNNTNKKMKNIEIRDFVPLIFSIGNFETLKPQITKTKEGYELTWKIKDLKPKEEIIISYQIKPLVEIIGEIKLPKPKVKYVLR